MPASQPTGSTARSAETKIVVHGSRRISKSLLLRFLRTRHGNDSESSNYDILCKEVYFKEVYEQVKAQLNQIRLERTFETETSYSVEGFTTAEDAAQGQSFVRLVDTCGRRLEGHVGYVDAFSSNPTQSVPVQPQGGVQSPPPERSADEIAQDLTQPLSARSNALNEWIVFANDSAAKFVLSQLEQVPTDDEWLSALVFAAEDVRFPTVEQQDKAAQLLRVVALKLRNRPETRFEQVVWSAVRRFGSLVPVEQSAQFLDFLDRTGSVDTRLVALQSTVHLFETEPPVDPATTKPLADRVFELAITLLHRDVLVPGEIAAIVEQAILGLASMGDPRLKECMTRLNSLKMPWFTELVIRGLRDLQRELAEHSTSPAIEQLNEVLGSGR